MQFMFVFTATWLALFVSRLQFDQDNAPAAESLRSESSVVWTGLEFIVWGGFDGTRELADGVVINPFGWSTRRISNKNAPSPRQGHVAVWTGNSMLVWGGVTDNNSYIDGGIYDPVDDRWTRISCPLETNGRRNATAVWTGSEMIIWGGINGSHILGDGLAFNPKTRTWRAIADTDAPLPRVAHLSIWTGEEMIVWGGRNRLINGPPLDSGARFCPENDTWTPIATREDVHGRQHAFGQIEGRCLIISSGIGKDGQRVENDLSYDLDEDRWNHVSR